MLWSDADDRIVRVVRGPLVHGYLIEPNQHMSRNLEHLNRARLAIADANLQLFYVIYHECQFYIQIQHDHRA